MIEGSGSGGSGMVGGNLSSLSLLLLSGPPVIWSTVDLRISGAIGGFLWWDSILCNSFLFLLFLVVWGSESLKQLRSTKGLCRRARPHGIVYRIRLHISLSTIISSTVRIY